MDLNSIILIFLLFYTALSYTWYDYMLGVEVMETVKSLKESGDLNDGDVVELESMTDYLIEKNPAILTLAMMKLFFGVLTWVALIAAIVKLIAAVI